MNFDYILIELAHLAYVQLTGWEMVKYKLFMQIEKLYGNW